MTTVTNYGILVNLQCCQFNNFQVFPLAQFYNTLQGTLSIIMSNAVSFLAEALISVQRLEAFMLFGTWGSAPPHAALANCMTIRFTNAA